MKIFFFFLSFLKQTTGYGQEGKFSGPLKPMTFSIFEGQEPSQIIFQVIAVLDHCYLDFAGSQTGLLLLYLRCTRK